MSLLAFFGLLTGCLSERTQRNRRRLGRQIGLLVGLCSLPLAGLAFYFLSTGLAADISRGNRERSGLIHIDQAVGLLRQTANLLWSTSAADEEVARGFESELQALETTGVAPLTSRAISITSGNSSLDARELRLLWRQAVQAPPDSLTRSAALQRVVGKLHHVLFQLSDQAGLTVSPEAETGALTEIVASLLPQHVERMLLLHERLVHGSPASSGEILAAATVFARQLEHVDVHRLDRSVAMALQADERTGHTLAAFQRDFPPRAEAFLTGLRHLVAAISPPDDQVAGLFSSSELDARLRVELEAALDFWRESVRQLDGLLADQIAHARSQRDRAFAATGVGFLLLLPVAWLYFRSFIKPVVQDMVDESLERQKRADEARLAADDSLRRLRQTQAALDDHCAVLVTDTAHRILAVNDRLCQCSGYSRAEWLGDSPRLFDATLPSGGPMESLRATVAAGRIWHGNLCQRAREGRIYWVNATVFPICDAAGRPVEYVSIQTDITELVSARETAEAAVTAKSRFLAMMSHEIRTPMNGVIGFANLLADTPLDSQQRDFVRTILTSGESLLTIINDVLDFSKLEAGRTELEARPVALRLLVEDVLELLAAQARGKGIELVYWIEADVPEGILGDETRLRQILLNLAGNALKFTAAGHVEIVIAVDSPIHDGARQLVIHVRDTGVGIPPERQDRLFKAFSQVDASITRSYGGTGLGLAISQHLVALMGGQIGVKSEPGKGSDFYFTLPVAEADVAAQLQTRSILAPQAIGAALSGRKVLVVDDLPANQRLLGGILAQHGAAMAAAHSGGEAMAMLDRERFDLAILDYLMPGMDGIAVAKAIRQRTDRPALPLILVTSAPLAQTEAPPGLFAAVISKPLRSVPFASAMAQALAGAKHVQPETAVSTEAGPVFAADHPLRLLVVDDNPVNLKVIAATLGSFGYQPVAVTHAAAALERLREEKFDLVLMDVQMPDLDGHEATRRLRAGAAGEINRRTRVVALTAGALAEERAACLGAGMDDFIAKPVPRAVLLEKLAAAAHLGRA